MSNLRRTTQDGFSLIELLIVITIIGIIVTFAILGLGNSSQVINRLTLAKEFKVALERSRFDSVKRRASDCSDMSRVEITSATSFRYITDMDQNGSVDPATESRVVDFAQMNVQIMEAAYPVTIRFDHRGETSSGPCAAEVPAQTPTVFCELPCATVTAANSSAVFVSPTGTMALLSGDEAIPTFADPTITNVDSNTGINQQLAVWTGTPPTPTPFPTPNGGTPTPTPTVTPTPSPTATVTPTPTPTVSPTPTPTVTPSPTVLPTPTPSPTPLPVCIRNERPGTPPACACLPPFFVQGNGQCK
ncbi:MAG: prepilin-type N-terminal cleavage/methylation domain-containing protein [Acidobacteriota bacterium]